MAVSKGGDNTQTAEEEKEEREKYRRDTRFVSYGLNSGKIYVESSGKSQCAFLYKFQCASVFLVTGRIPLVCKT